MDFTKWYEQHKNAIQLLENREQVAQYVWTNKPRTAKTSAKDLGGYTAEFEEYWVCYPKKIGKGAAFSAWNKIKMDKLLLSAKCVQAVEWQRETKSWREGYIPNPETYLNQRRWEDEPQETIKTKHSEVFF